MLGQRCYVCGTNSQFIPPEGNFREATCQSCGASKRNSDVAQVLASLFALCELERAMALPDVLPALRSRRVFYAGASWPLHERLSRLPGYSFAYFDKVALGGAVPGPHPEELIRLKFADNVFDLVITEDLLEHVSEPLLAIKEIRRVLVPNGFHVFTTPFHPQRTSQTRAIRTLAGIRHRLPPVYHGNRPSDRSLVFTEFGADLICALEEAGFRTKVLELGVWFRPDEITWIATDSNYEEHCQLRQQQGLLASFRYNSHVFVSQNLKLPLCEERLSPEVKNDNAYEHLHRYHAVQNLVKGKAVLDIACGEGYGCVLLAKSASSVVGVDIDPMVVEYATARYAFARNVEFRCGTCEKLPASDASFDAVVSFETIEHLDDQQLFVREIKRVLKADGCLVISSPNKTVYSDITGHHNPYHKSELYLDQFTSLLNQHFAFTEFYGQRMTLSSTVWPLCQAPVLAFEHYGSASSQTAAWQPPFDAMYFVAVCSDRPFASRLGPSLYTDRTDYLFRGVEEVRLSVRHLMREIAQKELVIQQLERELTTAAKGSASPLTELPVGPSPARAACASSCGEQVNESVARPSIPRVSKERPPRVIHGWTALRVPDNPKVSLAIATYGQHDELACLMYSLKAQTYENWEAVIVHDGPGPEVRQLIEDLADPRICLIEAPERKQQHGHPWRQLGIDACTGAFIGLSNGDNYYAPVYFEWMLHALVTANADFAYCNMVHSHRRWSYFPTVPRKDGIDLGAWIGRTDLVRATPWRDFDFGGDGTFIEDLLSRARGIVHVPGCLFVHN